MSIVPIVWENPVLDTTYTQRYGKKWPIFGCFYDKNGRYLDILGGSHFLSCHKADQNPVKDATYMAENT